MKTLLIFFFLIIPTFAFDKEYYSLDYIYVNANTGQSSGGHSAIRLGNLVYHFQYYPDKVFHIIREPWEEFRYVYGIQENRTIWIRKVNLSRDNFNFFLEGMNEIYLIQKKELDNLVKLENDVKILESIVMGDKFVHLKAAGYFLSQGNGKGNYGNLHRKINSNLGNNFVLKNLNFIRKKIYNFKFPLIDAIKINSENNHYPIGVGSFSTEYLDLLSLLKAFEVLQEESDLEPFSFFEFQSEKSSNLSNNQLKQFSLFSINLEDEILSLLESNLDNQGYPLLVLIARYLVIQKSIKDKKFYFLDAFNKNHSLIIGEVIQNKPYLKSINNQISKKILISLKNLFKTENIDEKDYTLLEDMVNRQREILNGLKQSDPIRINYELMIPAKEEKVPIHHNQMSNDTFGVLLGIAVSNKAKYQLAMQKKYSFNLFNKNCTTEIFNSINSFFERGDTESKEKIGGVVHGNDFLIFVPVYAYYAVEQNYKVMKEQIIPSLRNQILEKNSSKGYYFSVKESSTLTSKFYKFNKEDSFFILFTDNIFWQRPIYGLVNLVAGLGEVGFGICMSPFDKGNHFIKGLQGVFFSGPELLFFNIRKGTFIYEGKPEGTEFDE